MGFQDRLLSGDLPITPTQALGLTIIVAVLFLSSFVVEVTLIVESPEIGNITPQLGMLWRATTGIATLISSVLTVISFTADEEQATGTRGPETGFVVEGDNNDLDVHFHIPDRQHGSNSSEPIEDGASTPQEQTDDEDRESEEVD
ncbi:hypothetical protein [Haloterrigena turkmenica]|uniref:hypothetical protein n=1 Tax=Haloterrigena turkmenica TaxID=62320 RepID=UPI0011D12F88|nr:hypothetical protein [Haloterrigena turkmenica]